MVRFKAGYKDNLERCKGNFEVEVLRIKADYESDLDAHKNNLNELNSNYQKALSNNIRWEKDATSLKEELNDVLDENDKRARCANALEDKLSDARSGLERAASQLQSS